MYLLCFYVPATHLEQVKNALFQAGAGKIENYSHCAWQVLGEGQYKPLLGSQPFSGSLEQVEKVAEYKVEIICEASHIEKVITALKTTHPYETPAYHVIALHPLSSESSS